MTDRRSFMQTAGLAAFGGALPMTFIKLAFAKPEMNFTFAYISDSHLQQVKGSKFVNNFDRGLIRAVAEANLLDPKPDFFVYGGDLAQLGKRAELDHGAEILSRLHGTVHHVMGEHDYYLDLGEHWSKLYGPQWYSFDHKGVHFVVLNSLLTDEQWTLRRWPSAEERMNQMAVLDNPNGSPFMVGQKQRQWLAQDLDKVSKETPVVVFSHSPLQKIYKGWNFWTDDADEIQALLRPFKQANVMYGHVHQIQYNQIGNISFNSVMSTGWPWPYPASFAHAQNVMMPSLTVPMDRADPFFERDATGWQFIDVHSGRIAEHFQLWDNQPRTVAYNEQEGHPVDTGFQAASTRIVPQTHY